MNDEKPKVILEMCRTCMWHITEETHIVHIDTASDSKDKSVTIRAKLSCCIPEMELNDKLSLVICNDCAVALDFSYKFKQKCLETENLVRSYLEEKAACVALPNPEVEESLPSVSAVGQNEQPRLQIVDSDLVLLNNDSLDGFEIVDQEMEAGTENDTGQIVEEVIILLEQGNNSEAASVPTDNADNNTNWINAYTLPDTEDNSASVDKDADSPNVVSISKDSPPKTDKSKKLIEMLKVMKAPGKTYRCKVCEFSTKVNAAIIAHVKSHKNLQRFTCKYCGFDTIHNKEMIAHLKSHTNPSSYKCSKCRFTSKCPNIILKHINLNCKHIACKDCDKIFSRRRTLEEHVKKVHSVSNDSSGVAKSSDDNSDVICLD